MELKSGYKQTEVGVIPEDWGNCTIQDLIDRNVIVEHLDGNHGELYPRSHEFRGFGVPYITANDLTGRGVSFANCKFLPENRARQFRKGLARNGDVLFAHNATVGPTGLLSTNLDYVILSTTATYFRCDLEELNNEFFLYLLQSPLFIPQYQAVMSQSTRNQVPITAQRKLLVVIPPTLAEQEAIAEALSDADALIDSLEQLITKKRQLKQGAMQNLLTGKKRLPSFSGEWRTVPLVDVIDHCSSGATPYRGRAEFYKGTVKWISSGELNYNVIGDTIEHISEEAVRKTNLKIHPAGTFLMAITGLEAAGTRGSCGIVGSPATTNQSCMAIYPNEELLTEYLFHYYVFRGDELALTYCQGTKQQSYTARLVKILPIELPPTIDEQTAIATILSDMDTEIAALEAKLAKSRQLKQAMMQELLTGKTRLV